MCFNLLVPGCEIVIPSLMTHLLIRLVGMSTDEIKENKRKEEITLKPLVGLLAHIGVELLPGSHMRRTSQCC